MYRRLLPATALVFLLVLPARIEIVAAYQHQPLLRASIAAPFPLGFYNRHETGSEILPMQSGCDDDSVDSVNDDGTILKTLYNHVYDIFDGAIDVALWLPADDLLVCPTVRLGVYRIINTDERNEVAYGRRLR